MALAGTAFINFEGQFDGVARDARRFGDRAGADYSSGFGKKSQAGILGSFRRIAGAGAAIFAGAQVVSLFGDFIDEARESAKVGRITANVIKQTGGVANISAKGVGNLAQAISNKTGIDDEQIQTAANMLLTFKNVRNEAGKNNDIFNRSTRAAADLSVQFGGIDGASKQLGKALQDPVKGIAALGRAGVTFSSTQKEQIANFVKTGDLLSAQKIILGEVEGQVGGAAAAAADPMQKLGVIVDNLKERIGTALLPVIEKGATWLGQFLPAALTMAGKGFGYLSDLLGPVVAGIKQAFDVLFKGDFSGGATGPFEEDSPFVDGLFRVREFIVGKLLPAFGQIAGFLKDNIQPVLAVVGIAFFGLAGALAAAYLKFEPFRNAVNGLASTLADGIGMTLQWITKTVLPGAKKALGSFLDGIQGKGGEGSFFTDLGEGARTLATLFTETLFPAAKKVFDWFTNLGKPTLIAIGVAFAALMSPVLVLVGGFIYAYQKFEWFRTGIATVFGLVKTIITTAINVIVFTLTNLIAPAVSFLVGLFTNILWPAVQMVWAGISTAIRIAWGIAQPIFALISWTVSNVLVPVFRFLMGVAQFVFSILWAVIRDAWSLVRPIFLSIVGFIRDQLVPKFVAFKTTAMLVWAAVHRGISAAWRIVSPIFLSIVGFVRDHLIPVWSGISDAVSKAFEKIPTIISGALRTAGNTIAGFLRGASGIADKIGLSSVAAALSSGAAKADSWGEGGGGKGPKKMASGGTVPPFVTNGARAIVGEGNPRYPEYVIPTDPKYRARARALWEQAGPQLLAKGGIIGGGFDKLKSIGGGLKDLGGDLLGNLRSVVGGGLEKIWPTLPVSDNLLGLAPGGHNYMRKGIIDFVKGEAKKREEAEKAKESAAGLGGLAASATGINPDFLRRFRLWTAATGNKYSIGSGFRSSAKQAILYDKYLHHGGNLAAPPGRSNHEKGLAIDVSPSQTSAADRALAPKFGLRFPLLAKGEPWHIEPFARGGVLPVSKHARSFDAGGTLNTGWNMVRNDTGAPEPLVPAGHQVPLVNIEQVNEPVDVDMVIQKISFARMAGAFG